MPHQCWGTIQVTQKSITVLGWVQSNLIHGLNFREKKISHHFFEDSAYNNDWFPPCKQQDVNQLWQKLCKSRWIGQYSLKAYCINTASHTVSRSFLWHIYDSGTLVCQVKYMIY